MDTKSLTTRAALRWAITVVREAEAEYTRVPRPTLAQIQLGDLMVRTDPETCFDIAQDIEVAERIESAFESIRTHWGARPVQRRSRRGAYEAQYEVASAAVQALQRHFRGEQRRLLEQGSTARSFTALEEHWPGRVYWSLRDEYDRYARQLYDAEKNIICVTSDLALKLGKLRRVRR